MNFPVFPPAKPTIPVIITIVALAFLSAASPARAAAGVEEWVRRYNGPGDGHDYAKAIAVDATGNVFVTGYSRGIGSGDDYTTIKYSSAGAGIWTNRFNGQYNDYDQANAIAVDRSSGNVFVTGTTGAPQISDWTTLFYSNGGLPLRTNYYDGPGFTSSDYATSITTDTQGNVIVAGYSYGTNSHSDFFTVTYSGLGAVLRSNFFDNAGNNERATRVAVDAGGNIVVTGTTANLGIPDWATIKYSNLGTPLWTNYFNGPGNFDDFATALAIDGNSNVIVAGYVYVPSGFHDYATIKYSSQGAPLWTNYYNGTSLNVPDPPIIAIAVDASDNVLVTGTSLNDEFTPDYGTIKYSSAGVPLWTNAYNGPSNGAETARAIAVDASGNVFVTGDATTTNGQDYATIAYSPAGVPLWTNLYNGPGDNSDYARAIAVDTDGNVFVTGYSYNRTNHDYATIKYSGAGAVVTPIPLHIQKLDNQVVLTWDNPAFGLQMAPLVTGTYTNISGATSPYTNGITGSQRFFRLRAN